MDEWTIYKAYEYNLDSTGVPNYTPYSNVIICLDKAIICSYNIISSKVVLIFIFYRLTSY